MCTRMRTTCTIHTHYTQHIHDIRATHKHMHTHTKYNMYHTHKHMHKDTNIDYSQCTAYIHTIQKYIHNTQTHSQTQHTHTTAVEKQVNLATQHVSICGNSVPHQARYLTVQFIQHQLPKDTYRLGQRPWRLTHKPYVGTYTSDQLATK